MGSSSLTRYRIAGGGGSPALGVRSLSHWTTGEVPAGKLAAVHLPGTGKCGSITAIKSKEESHIKSYSEIFLKNVSFRNTRKVLAEKVLIRNRIVNCTTVMLADEGKLELH